MPNVITNQDIISPEREIFLVRHGEFEGAELRRCIGRLDIPLSKKGWEEARRAGIWLAGRLPRFSLWSSPLSRCTETAAAIRKETGCGPVHIENSLAEMAAGAWEGMTFAEIQEKYPAEYEARGRNLIHYQTPDGESFFDAGARFLSGLQKILLLEESEAAAQNHGGQNSTPATLLPLVVVAHSGVIRSALCHLGAWSFDYMLCIPQPNAGVSVLRAKKEETDGSWKLIPTEEIGITTAPAHFPE